MFEKRFEQSGREHVLGDIRRNRPDAGIGEVDIDPGQARSIGRREAIKNVAFVGVMALALVGAVRSLEGQPTSDSSHPGTTTELPAPTTNR